MNVDAEEKLMLVVMEALRTIEYDTLVVHVLLSSNYRHFIQDQCAGLRLSAIKDTRRITSALRRLKAVLEPRRSYFSGTCGLHTRRTLHIAASRCFFPTFSRVAHERWERHISVVSEDVWNVTLWVKRERQTVVMPKNLRRWKILAEYFYNFDKRRYQNRTFSSLLCTNFETEIEKTMRFTFLVTPDMYHVGILFLNCFGH